MGFDKYGSGETFESCDKFGSGGVLYVPGVSELIKPVDTVPMEQAFQQAKEKLLQIYQPVIEECARIVQEIMDVLVPCIQPVMDEIIRTMDLILESYPDKRIVWLALHHKKERIRKKNRNRILKWIERSAKRGNKKNC